MQRHDDEDRSARAVDFFVSYSPADERWATWIAWELESAGYSTLVQAWDFVPGTNFIDFMDRGLSAATVVISILTDNYLRSRYGRLEWQTALRAEPGRVGSRLVTIRVEECRLEGLLSTITYVDLVGVTDPERARSLLMRRLEDALGGRAKPSSQPTYPHEPAGVVEHTGEPTRRAGTGRVDAHHGPARRTPATAPGYPAGAAAAQPSRRGLALLHIAGPRIGREPGSAGTPLAMDDLQSRVWADVTRLVDAGARQPDLMLVTGNLTDSGSVRQFAAATEFLTGLRVLLGLEPSRLVVVPGRHDLTRAACRAYFESCTADEIAPKPPYWPKWRHFARMFEELYHGLDDLIFDSQQPWTLFPMPELGVVVAGLNSTMRDSHRDEDHYGWIGEGQAAWFAHRLARYEQLGWLRIGVASHRPAAPDQDPPDADGGWLRDTVSVDQVLGRRLNLMVHDGGSGLPIGELGSGLTVVPAPGTVPYQLIGVTADRLTRWEPADARPRERVERHWHHVGATFPDDDGVGTPNGRVGGRTDPAEQLVISGQPDATAMLLERIVEVCRITYPDAKIRSGPGEFRHFLVTYGQEGFVRQFRIGGLVGTPTREDIVRFLDQVHATDPDLPSELVYQGPPVSQALREEAMRRGVHLRSFTEFQGLLDLRGFVAAQTAELRSDAQYAPDLYVPQRYRELSGSDRAVRPDLIGNVLRLLAPDDGRFLLILGDFGRGKTFALRELARRLPTELPHLVPILIELRALDKSPTVDGLVAAHLANHGEEQINLKAFNYMLRQGRIVLLFDGFDELAARVTYDRAADHLRTLLEAAQDKAKIVVSSRTQHFRTEAQVLTALAERVGLLPQRRLLSIEDFEPAQVRSYLLNRYGEQSIADKKLEFIRATQDLLGLSQNPRMLSFIADLDDVRLAAVANAKQAVSAAGLYEEILGAWLNYELQRLQDIGGGPLALTMDELWNAVTTLASRLWESNEPYLKSDELAEVADALELLADRGLSLPQAVHAVGSGSLLVRTEGGLFGFIHTSVAEWLVARDVARQFGAGGSAPAVLSRRMLPQLTVEFLCDLADARTIQEWLRPVLADATAGDIDRANALRISARLRMTAWTDLRNAVLKGEDLSYRDLQDADLTGADLTEATLAGADLTRASLRNARLVGTRLDRAKLTNADLRGADLSRARLAGTDLRDAALAGSRWRRASLLKVTAAPGLAATPELRGAAIAPGQEVEVQLSPPEVGVAFGFETGRLPQPVAYSPDGDTIAIGSNDGGVLLCDTHSGQPLRTLQGHRGRVYAVAYGPADTVLATGSVDGTVNLWDPVTPRVPRRLSGHQGWVWPMEVGPDGRTVVAGDSSGTVRVWDVASGSLRHELPGHAPRIWTAAFHPDGVLLATGDAAGAIRVWDVDTGALRYQVSGAGGSVNRVAFSPDGRYLAAAYDTGPAQLLDPADGTLRHELLGHRGRVYCLVFQPGGAMLATGDTNGAVYLWDVVGEPRGTPLTEHSGAVYGISFTPDGSMMATGDSDGVLRLWDSASRHLRRDILTAHKASVWPTVVRPDGMQLASSSSDGTTRLWDPDTGQCRHVLRGHGRRVTSLSFSPDGRTLTSSGNDGTVHVWNPRTGVRLGLLESPASPLVTAFHNPAEPTMVATPGLDGGLLLWNLERMAYERELNLETDHLWAATFSPDGDVLATANDDDTVRLWYRTTNRQIGTLSEHRGRVRSIAFSPDGRLIATGCDDRTVRVWPFPDGDCFSFRGHTDRVSTVAFNQDGSVLLSAGHDGTARLWDLATQSLVRTLSGHVGRIWTAAFSPDGTLLATAGDDLVVRLWDPRSGRHVETLTGHLRKVLSLCFSPDGSLLATGGEDGTVRMWAVTGSGLSHRITLLGLPRGWAALAPDGRYKTHGDVTGQFWHVVGMCRFEPNELEEYLDEVRELFLAAEF
jgi:WD40 repeat protein/3',5'-cyclic AMP phosphodiesterase CpdA